MKNYEKEYKELGIKYNKEYYDANTFGKQLKTSFPKQKNVTYSSDTDSKNKNVSTNLVYFK